MLHFSTKADTLKEMATVMQSAKILPQVSFTIKDYRQNKHYPLELLQGANLLDQVLIVRSSAKNEDTESTSNAGKFLSLLNIQGECAIVDAIAQVVAAMDQDEANQVFIQPYLQQVELCGVAFTVDPNTGGNYYVVNYDDATGSTSSVTGGFGEGLKTYYQFKGETKGTDKLQGVIAACVEIETLFANQAVDIEFAIANQQLYILQVRPLVLTKKVADFAEQLADIQKITQKVASAMGKQPNIFGEKAIFGVMPDWNPAEMIGIRPHPLALSLYKEIITDSVWAYQRNNYGYKNLRSFPLMLDICGLPYIDTRVSFNSFLPETLSDALSEKLMGYYLQQLEQDPSKHDKIEFEIAFTCYTFDLQERLQKLKAFDFTDAEIDTLREALRQLTNRVIDNEQGLWKHDSAKIAILKKQHRLIMDSEMDSVSKIYWLLEYCKRYGTLPFAGLARAGFIAAELLESLVHTQIMTEQEKALYMNGLSTIGKNISIDFQKLSRPAFMKSYGHLRPGTYDICSARYDQSGDDYFDFTRRTPENMLDHAEFKLSLAQYAAIQRMLEEHGLKGNVLQLFEFIKAAIEGREYSKYVFTETVSDVLELLAKLGATYGFSREEMSFLHIADLMRAYSTADDIKDVLADSIAKGQQNYRHTMGLVLPPVIADLGQIACFYLPEGEPNFITQKNCEADVVIIDETKQEIGGKIVLIKSADPGFDWIFSHNIAGFVTAYGGVNSHMAIRAAEFGIPAIIGVGEKLFAQYCQGKRLSFDCANRKVFVLQ